MTTPSVTLKSLKNEDSGIDISIPKFIEEEAPLGGVSILYEISVLTRLDVFKTALHKSQDVVYFTIYKAYREIADLYSKLTKKYPKANLPVVPNLIKAAKCTSEEKVNALNNFVSALAENKEICLCSIFTQFIGIHSQKPPIFSDPNAETSSNCDTNSNTNVARKELPTETSADVNEVFPKVKNYSFEKLQSVPSVEKNIDLFEEVKLNKDKDGDKVQMKSSTSQGLFDEFEDDNLFTSKPPDKMPVVVPKEKTVERVTEVKKPEPPKTKQKDVRGEAVDDSQVIIANRKIGDVSLFQEQDLGEFITKDEEALFLVTSPTTNKKNTLLFFEEEISSPEQDNSVNESLDDLLNLDPLPSSSSSDEKSREVENLTEPPKEPSNISETKPPVPVPRARNKSISSSETDSSQRKPEVLPRKVFLSQQSTLPASEKSNRPPVPAKPSGINSKPAPPPKPKPPPKKPKSSVMSENKNPQSDTIPAKASEKSDSNVVFGLGDDLKELDILKYIEQEEKSLDSKLSLFD